MNDDIGHYFQTHKGLRQGDPMSLILFNIVVDTLTILIGRAKDAGQVGGLVPHLVDGGISILQYTDDTYHLYGARLGESEKHEASVMLI